MCLVQTTVLINLEVCNENAYLKEPMKLSGMLAL